MEGGMTDILSIYAPANRVKLLTVAGSLVAGGTIIALQPGQSWNFIAGQTTQTFANATSSGHRFTAVYWTNT